eukprot:TRINITY_DN7887_c0_g1_i1.p1 TRINITY_DN7887_c0_g1~~TRINITY_DN7887_c0_g1_i1.p1  ORF type:complete len:118 (-),score=10.55 TRINITY_DN7887_c0_g1_i1:7-360(-)
MFETLSMLASMWLRASMHGSSASTTPMPLRSGQMAVIVPLKANITQRWMKCYIIPRHVPTLRLAEPFLAEAFLPDLGVYLIHIAVSVTVAVSAPSCRYVEAKIPHGAGKQATSRQRP